MTDKERLEKLRDSLENWVLISEQLAFSEKIKPERQCYWKGKIVLAESLLDTYFS